MIDENSRLVSIRFENKNYIPNQIDVKNILRRVNHGINSFKRLLNEGKTSYIDVKVEITKLRDENIKIIVDGDFENNIDIKINEEKISSVRKDNINSDFEDFLNLYPKPTKPLPLIPVKKVKLWEISHMKKCT